MQCPLHNRHGRGLLDGVGSRAGLGFLICSCRIEQPTIIVTTYMHCAVNLSTVILRHRPRPPPSRFIWFIRDTVRRTESNGRDPGLPEWFTCILQIVSRTPNIRN
jgi:hypothetical protein